MSVVLAAAPFEEFARDNSPVLAAIICLILALLTARLVARNVTRIILFGLITAAALFVVVEQDEITECTQTCRCQLAGVDTKIPWCNRDLPRTGT